MWTLFYALTIPLFIAVQLHGWIVAPIKSQSEITQVISSTTHEQEGISRIVKNYSTDVGINSDVANLAITEDDISANVEELYASTEDRVKEELGYIQEEMSDSEEEYLSDDEEKVDVEDESPKLLVSEKTESKPEISEDIVVYDYSAPKAVKKEAKVASSFNQSKNSAEVVGKYIAKNSKPRETEHSTSANGFMSTEDSQAQLQTVLTLNVSEASVQKHPLKDIFVTRAVDNERYYTDLLGEVDIEEPLSIASDIDFKLEGSQYVPTRMTVRLDPNATNYQSIPMVTQLDFSNMYTEFGLKGDYSAVLVKIDESVKETFVYEDVPKVLLNSNFARVSSIQDAQYVLFLGLLPGQVVMEFQVSDEIVKSSVFTEQNVITFLDLSARESMPIEIALFETLPFATKPSELLVNAEKIHSQYDDIWVEKVANNVYGFQKKWELSGITSMGLIQHGPNQFHFMLDKSKKQVLPSPESITHLLDVLELDDNLNNSCIVQLDLNKSVDRVNYWNDLVDETGRFQKKMVFNGDMYARFLDKDGVFYETASPETQRAYLVAEGEGKVHLQLEFSDGSVAYKEVNCLNSMYIIDEI
jgi:hypothetical protein